GERSAQNRHARRMWHLPGENTLSRGRTNRRIAIVRCEPCSFGSETIKIRRSRLPVSVGSEHIPCVIVRKNEQQIGFALRSSGCLPASDTAGGETTENGTASWVARGHTARSFSITGIWQRGN